MFGCGTTTEGRAVIEVRGGSMSIYEYEYWVRNYIAVQQGVKEGRYKPEEVDWSTTTLYIKPDRGLTLDPVELKITEFSDGKVKVAFWEWDAYEDEEVPYTVEGQPLEFTYDPYEGLTRYTLTIVPRQDPDEPKPEGWNGAFLFDPNCPVPFKNRWRPELWKWIDSHTLDVRVSGDVLVTPYGQDSGVENPIAVREWAFKVNR